MKGPKFTEAQIAFVLKQADELEGFCVYTLPVDRCVKIANWLLLDPESSSEKIYIFGYGTEGALIKICIFSWKFAAYPVIKISPSNIIKNATVPAQK